MTRSGDNEQPAAGKTTVAADDNNGGVVNNTDAPTDTAKPPVDGYVSEYKRYEIKYSDNNYFTIFLRYRENSDYVAEITGAVKIPAGSSEYNSMLADDAIIQQKLKDNGMDNSVANWSSVELTSGLSTSFSFYKLDEGNPNLVAIASEALDLPASGGYFRLSECEQFLLANGFKLVDYSK